MNYYYTTSISDADLDTALAGGVGALFGAMLGIFLIIGLVLIVIQIIAMWKIFTKAGQAGWKSIIPIYNLVTMFKIAGISPWLILLYLLAFIPFFGWLISVGLSIYFTIKLAQAFNKGTGFTVGLILLPSIFYLILGLGKSQYVGPKAEPVNTSGTVNNNESNTQTPSEIDPISENDKK